MWITSLLSKFFSRGEQSISQNSEESSESSTTLHDHSWNLVSKTYAAPRAEVEATGISESVFEKALFGVTTLVYQCDQCHQFYLTEVLGSSDNVLEDTLLRVETLGPQALRRGDNIYVINKYVPPTQQGGYVAVK